MNLHNKNVLVVGLGISGTAAGRLLLRHGARVWITEKEVSPKTKTLAEAFTKEGAVVELGGHSEEFVRGKDFIVISPGVDKKNEVMRYAAKYEISVISEIELACWYVKCPLICVTGTNGKSTVTSLIDDIFKSAGKKSIACGNLGKPMSEIALEGKKLDYAVVEVSSFQLEYVKSFRPYVSVWLNFSYDHLDHHASMDEYLAAKLRIFENQTEEDWAVIYYEEEGRVGDIRANKVIYGQDVELENYQDKTLLKGRHNYENISAAAAVAKICGISDEAFYVALKNFRPLSHRTEHVANINGVDFIDDSKATNVHAVIPALNGFTKPIILILGGRDKGDDFTRLKEAVKEKVQLVVVIGEASDKIVSQLNGNTPIHKAKTMADAVEYSFKHSHPGTTVLLSPGCSSFDMFKDYKDRGRFFREAVNSLKEHSIVTVKDGGPSLE